MSNFADIRAAIIAPWVANSEFSLTTAYPNSDFDPVEQIEPWAKVDIIESIAESIEIGALLQDEMPGFLQVDLMYPSGKGDLSARQKADEILAVYKRGQKFTRNATCVRITDIGIATPNSNLQGWYRLVLTINFETRFNNR